MTDFHDGQEVEVAVLSDGERPFRVWRKCRIIYKTKIMHEDVTAYVVDSSHGGRRLFEPKDIRPSGVDF
jgi:hypothetical protein